jgi:hypothetical protein
MPSSGMLSRVDLVRTDVLEECIASIIRVTIIGVLGTLAVTNNRSTLRRNTISHTAFLRSVLRLLVTANAVPCSPILVTLMMEPIRSSVTSVITRATRRNIPDYGILQIFSSRSHFSKATSHHYPNICGTANPLRWPISSQLSSHLSAPVPYCNPGNKADSELVGRGFQPDEMAGPP